MLNIPPRLLGLMPSLAALRHFKSRQHSSDPAPPSSSAGGFEKYDDYAAQGASRPFLHDEPYLTPYLGLRARLSQTWINRWTILLLLVLVRTLFAIASVDENLGSARKQALSMCTSVENVGSAMASMPYYMSQGVNELTANGITKAINGLMDMLVLSITAIEEIVLFIINMMIGTYVCLITLAVGGSLHVAISVAEDVGNLINSTVKDVGQDLGAAASTFQSAMNSFMSDIDKIGNFLTGDDSSPPTIDLTSEISALDNLQLPAGYDQGLDKLNSSIPTFATVKNFTETVVSIPFNQVKQLLNASLPNYTMDASLFPVPAKQQLTFCSDNNGVNEFFDDLVKIERIAKKVFLAVIIIAAILAMLPMAWHEIRQWRRMKQNAALMESATNDPLDAVYVVSRPHTAAAGLKAASRFASARRRAAVRWSFAYATTMPALFVLSLALAGLLACLCQYILLKVMQKEIPIIENEIIGFADQVIYSLNNASEQWAVGTNKMINDTNTKINDDVFGWVNTTTTAVNDTLNGFVDGMVDVLNVTFGGTVLYEPILDVLNCLILLKIQGIEKGLTWVSDNAYIEMPSISNDTFSVGALSKVSDSSTDILSTSNSTGAADAMSDAVYYVMKALEATIRQETIISFCLLLIWLLIAMIGVGRAGYIFYKGGDHGVYPGPEKRDPSPSLNEKYTTGVFPHYTVPAYEQTAITSRPTDQSANKFCGQAYTLTPAPVPTFELNSSAPPILNSTFTPSTGKVGTVNGQNVDSAIRRQTHVRASSHGDYAVTSPTSPPYANPFLNVPETQGRTPNPFADPRQPNRR